MKNLLKTTIFLMFVMLVANVAEAQQQYPQGQQQYPQGEQQQYQQQYPNSAPQQVQGYQQQQRYVVPQYVVRKQQRIENGDGVFGLAKSKAIVVFRNIRSIVFILGGFALVGLAVAAIFGKPNWKWFGLLAVGIFVVAIAGAIVEFLAGQSNDLGNTIQTPVHQQPVYQQPVQSQPVYR